MSETAINPPSGSLISTVFALAPVQGVENHRSDAEAVDVVVPSGVNVLKGQLVYIDGWHGVAMTAGAPGTTIALEIDEDEYEFDVGSLSAAKGNVLYLDPTTPPGAISSDTSKRAVLKITLAKDANNIVWAKVLPNLTA